MRKLLLTVGLLGSVVCKAQGADLPTKALSPAPAPSCFASATNFFQANPQECPRPNEAIGIAVAAGVGLGVASAAWGPGWGWGDPGWGYAGWGGCTLLQQVWTGWGWRVVPGNVC
jgi:hypothetical protein